MPATKLVDATELTDKLTEILVTEMKAIAGSLATELSDHLSAMLDGHQSASHMMASHDVCRALTQAEFNHADKQVEVVYKRNVKQQRKKKKKESSDEDEPVPAKKKKTWVPAIISHSGLSPYDAAKRHIQRAHDNDNQIKALLKGQQELRSAVIALGNCVDSLRHELGTRLVEDDEVATGPSGRFTYSAGGRFHPGAGAPPRPGRKDARRHLLKSSKAKSKAEAAAFGEDECGGSVADDDADGDDNDESIGQVPKSVRPGDRSALIAKFTLPVDEETTKDILAALSIEQTAVSSLLPPLPLCPARLALAAAPVPATAHALGRCRSCRPSPSTQPPAALAPAPQRPCSQLSHRHLCCPLCRPLAISPSAS